MRRPQVERLKVFCSNTRELEEEALVLLELLKEYSMGEGLENGVIFQPIQWKQALGGVTRPQDRPNGLLADCDFLILTLGRLWGSPTGTETMPEYNSGSVEELARALEHLGDASMPMRDILIMFKEISPEFLQDPGPQLQKIILLRGGIEDAKELLYKQYGDLNSYRRIVSEHLRAWSLQIAQGELKVGRKLPAMKRLVEKLGRDQLSDESMLALETRYLVECRSKNVLSFKRRCDVEQNEPKGNSEGPRYAGESVKTDDSEEPTSSNFRPGPRRRPKGASGQMFSRHLLAACFFAVLITMSWVVGVEMQGRAAVQPEPRIVSIVELVEGSTVMRSSEGSVSLFRDQDTVLLLSLFQLPLYDSYLVEAKGGVEDSVVWKSQELGFVDLDRLNIFLPKGTMPLGNLSFYVYGVEDGERRQIQEFKAEVKDKGAREPYNGNI